MLGKSLGHYEILEPIGKGGMGEVYRARDTKLGRDVAIKVLPRELSGDAERIARFQREARTLATLQHPNVASIYGFEDTPEARFLVMELVEGQELAERLDRGAIPLEEIVETARQIALGLEAAHEQNVVHRDLKPANVKISREGTVKILDFGLARAYAGESDGDGDPAESPTITAAMTAAGTILGTAAYMSPEQARGRRIDKRADIWAFGVILYEMLVGHRLFEGETISDTLAGVLKTDIDLAALPAKTPPALRHLLGRCLERDPKSRLRDIGEARVLLEGPLGEAAPAAVASHASNRRLPIAIAAIVGIVLGATGLWIFAPRPPDAPPTRQVRFAVPVLSEDAPRTAFSPDGRQILHTGDGRLWLRAVDAVELRAVEGADGAVVANWSPDGNWIVYSTPQTMYKSRPDGSERMRLCEIPSDIHSWAGGIEWLDDGRIVFATGDAGLFVVGENGGDPDVLLAPDEDETDFHQIDALPDGKGFIFHVHKDLFFDTIGLWSNGIRKEILKHPQLELGFAHYASGHILYSRGPENRGIWAVPFSLESLETTGSPFLLVPDGTFPSVSQRGDIAYVRSGSTVMRLVHLDAEGRELRVIGEAISGAQDMDISADGSQAVVLIEEQTSVLWLVDLATGERRRLSFKDIDIDNPSWSANGNWILYDTGSAGSEFHVEMLNVNDGRSRIVDVRGVGPVLTSDERYLVLEIWNAANDPSIGYLDLEDQDAEPVMLADSRFAESTPALSPDDEFVAYESLETGARQIMLKSFPDGESTWQISQGGGAQPFWSADGSRLYYTDLSNGWIMVVDVHSTPTRVSAPRRAFVNNAYRDVRQAPSGDYYALRREFGSGFSGYEIWLDWAASLKR